MPQMRPIVIEHRVLEQREISLSTTEPTSSFYSHRYWTPMDEMLGCPLGARHCRQLRDGVFGPMLVFAQNG
jgi:hypothetical protein